MEREGGQRESERERGIGERERKRERGRADIQTEGDRERARETQRGRGGGGQGGKTRSGEPLKSHKDRVKSRELGQMVLRYGCAAFRGASIVQP